MSANTRVVIIGAGVGGLACAKRLSGHRDLVDVTVIGQAATHDFAPSFLWLLDGTRSEEQVSRPARGIERYGATFINDSVLSVDPDAQVVRTASGDHHYDQLILAPGAELDPGSIDGLAQAAHFFFTRDDAMRLAGALQVFAGGRVLLVIPTLPYKCPAAPYEAAFLIDALLRKRGVDAQIEIRTIEPQPMPVAGPKIGRRVADLLKKRGIAYHTGQKLLRIDGDRAVAVFEQGEVSFDLLVAVPPHRAPDFIRSSPFAGPAGWVPVDEHTLAVPSYDNVHAMGDVTSIMLANGKPLPKAGVFAHAQAEVVADNIVAQARGAQPSATFDGHGTCFLEIGHGKAGLASGNFYATPDPNIRMFPPSRLGHLGKVLFERRWLRQLR